jgi:hypothetical protein
MAQARHELGLFGPLRYRRCRRRHGPDGQDAPHRQEVNDLTAQVDAAVTAIQALRGEFDAELAEVERLIHLGDRAAAEKELVTVEARWLGRQGVMRQLNQALWGKR